MKVVIIEDEPLAAKKLARYLTKYDSETEVLAQLNNVSTAVSWLRQYLDKVDLLFVDIQLHEELSFSIFQQMEINKPIVFTTAYDEYAIDAFQVNSIDYLLKPITFTQLSQALDKFKRLRNQWTNTDVSAGLIGAEKARYKDRFLVRRGNKIQSVRTSEISYFSAEGRLVSLHHLESRKYVLDYTLSELEGMLDPKSFFRTNRSYILQINAIQDVVVYSSSRLKVSVVGLASDHEIIVSRDRVGDFKNWLAGQG
ncbi:MAG: LytR/AlgR family response regulator transcription factor [Lewinella sp.]|uniref:LytR/AlgR family response regulator transcription factor n=1 Tax=Lewinella sp. TaxID=2004506 RepID=UPI003D6C6B04